MQRLAAQELLKLATGRVSAGVLVGTALAVRGVSVSGHLGAFVGLLLGLLFLSRGLARPR
jgi:hypothetical protein